MGYYTEKDHRHFGPSPPNPRADPTAPIKVLHVGKKNRVKCAQVEYGSAKVETVAIGNVVANGYAALLERYLVEITRVKERGREIGQSVRVHMMRKLEEWCALRTTIDDTPGKYNVEQKALHDYLKEHTKKHEDRSIGLGETARVIVHLSDIRMRMEGVRGRDLKHRG
jgi:hypothetical protein